MKLKTGKYKVHLTVLLLLVFAGMGSMATAVHSQPGSLADISKGEILNKKSLHTVTDLKTVLGEIENSYNISFLYDSQLVDGKYVVDSELPTDNSTHNLDSLLSSKGLMYKKETARTYLITKKPLAEEEELAVQETITGSVTDAETGEALPGVNIMVQGTSSGTATDMEGNYELTAASLEETLVFSYIGYQTQEVPINGRNEIEIALAVDFFGTEDLVVVGYGEQSRETLSGSVSSISGARMERIPVTNMSNSLTGQIPGIVSVNTSGEPGYDGANLNIRGVHTLGNNSPLIVIDGVTNRSGGLDRLNPRDIENISVLKDASAAIYGSQAANGVILITTKRGRAGETQFNLDINQGFNQPTYLPEMADAETYMTMLNEIDTYKGDTPRYTDERIQNHANQTDPWLYPNTDWFAEALKPVSYQSRADVSVSGGSEAMRYRLSFGGLTEDGYYNNSATRYNEYSFRSNIDGQLSENISMKFDLVGRMEDRNFPTQGADATFRMLMRGKPNEAGFWPNGLPAPDIENGTNPVVTGTDATGYDNNERYLFQSNISMTVEVPQVQGLSFTGNAAIDKDFQQRTLWQIPWTLYSFDGFDSNDEPVLNPSVVPYNDPRLTQWSEQGHNSTLNLLANFEKDFESHSYSILLGTEQQRMKNAGIQLYRRHFPSTQIDQMNAGGQDDQSISGGGRSLQNVPNEAVRMNFFSRINYSYQSKYMVELIGRYDGSYIFPEGNRFGFFPSVSTAWRLTQEDWFRSATNFFDELKLRLSVGQTGNDRIDEFQYLATYQLGGGAVFDHSEAQSIYQGSTPNPNITWEVANQFDVGLEGRILDDRFSFEVDYFRYLREDILHYRNASVPQSSGLSLPRENIGEVRSHGFDGSLGWQDQISQDFMIDINLSLGYAINEINYWDEPPGAPEWQRSTGMPMETGLFYQAIGVFETEADVKNYPSWPNARAGDIIFEDVNGDDEITADDRIRVDRTGTPKWNGGLNISGFYKSFDFTVLFQGSTGAAQYINTQSGDFGNYFAEFANQRWTPDNPNSEHPRAFNREEEYWIANANTYFLRNTDYLRLKNVEIGYNLPAAVSNRLNLDNMRVYANGFNLLTWDTFKLMDPETRNGAGHYYPQKRVINLGLSASF
ncbi:MAG: TonB-dependent receptor [Balneolales bacterium]